MIVGLLGKVRDRTNPNTRIFKYIFSAWWRIVALAWTRSQYSLKFRDNRERKY